MTERIHITPINDTRDHWDTANCWCAPVIEQLEHAVLVIHNAMDGREFFETEADLCDASAEAIKANKSV